MASAQCTVFFSSLVSKRWLHTRLLVVVVAFFQLHIVARTDPCRNIVSDHLCTAWKTYCKRSSYVQSNCAETCGECPGLFSTLLPISELQYQLTLLDLEFLSRIFEQWHAASQ